MVMISSKVNICFIGLSNFGVVFKSEKFLAFLNFSKLSWQTYVWFVVLSRFPNTNFS